MAENSQPTQDARISDMRREVDAVKNVMAANVASIMERGERLDSIERRTDELQASVRFRLFFIVYAPLESWTCGLGLF
ncbi:unnamed protein product [Strongylus vulgaris]|uniref:V-SNARE coiled-coil homology domain-containing protein n=1 Tax=Strongylus vulgaris TaxID=40348 RepID=A0A3P7LX98_STRVU|nr:unnamed protein product [Strongylus vulgaris]